MRAVLPLTAIAILFVAGCVQPSALQQASTGPARVLVAGAGDGAVVTWNGSGLTPTPDNAPPCVNLECAVYWSHACPTADSCRSVCDAGDCAKRAFELEGAAPARVVLAVMARTMNGAFSAEIADASGKVVARSVPGEYASVVTAEKLSPGAYEARVIADWGKDAFVATLHAEPAPAPATPVGAAARDLLPDLVTLAPRDLRIENPDNGFDPVAKLAGSSGCARYEFVEAQARRCLRFSNAVGNAGEGPLEVRLVGADEATGMAGQARFTQNIHRSDGTNRTQPVGVATYHPTHAHYHYAGLAHYDVYRYDITTQTMGAKLNEGRKSGFCFLDSGIQDLGKPLVTPYYYDNANCFDFLYSTAWGQVLPDEVMGISPGWFDYYNWYLDDQFVDITGAPDGAYELVSCANAEHTIVEANADNNCASVLFELKGDKVTTLGAAP